MRNVFFVPCFFYMVGAEIMQYTMCNTRRKAAKFIPFLFAAVKSAFLPHLLHKQEKRILSHARYIKMPGNIWDLDESET